MSTQTINYPLQFHGKTKSVLYKLGLLLLLVCSSLAIPVMAGGEQIQDIRPGVNTFADAIKSNPDLEYDIETEFRVDLVGTQYVTFVFQTLVFKDLGIKLISQEKEGEKWRLRKSKTQIMDVHIAKPALVFQRLQDMIPDLSKIAFPDESLKAVEKGLGKASRKSKRHLDYRELGLRFFFFESKGSSKMDRIRMLHWYPTNQQE